MSKRLLRACMFLCLVFFAGTFLVAAQPPAPPSAAGKDVLAYVSDADGDYEVYTLEMGSSPRQLTTNAISDWYPDWSPDGRQLAFGSGVDGADYEIVVVDVNCAQLPGGCAAAAKQLTDNDVNDIDPVWSPDGGQLAYVSDEAGIEDIYLMNASGGLGKPIIDNTVADKDPAWIPDGTGMVFSEKSTTDQDIVLIDFAGEVR
ncbi:MAG TPA: hypothetical protein VHO69_07170, partial [Phototrophicaceae bacterium]|nr:hypothetical protein [Phototrophicaceae bacterium]